MLDTTTTTIQAAIDDLDETIEERAETLVDLDPESGRYQGIVRETTNPQQMLYGLEWARDEWGPDTEIVVGAPTAGEQALMHEHADKDSPERLRIWFAAAATDTAPWADGSLKQTFQNLATVHPGLIDWIEAEANSCARPEGSEGNRLRQHYAAKQSQDSSETGHTSDTSSPSDSPTA